MDFGCFSAHPLVFFEELELMGNFLGEDLVGVVFVFFVASTDFLWRRSCRSIRFFSLLD